MKKELFRGPNIVKIMTITKNKAITSNDILAVTYKPALNVAFLLFFF